jgi:hypothetical protein
VRVHLARKHPLELEPLDVGLEARHVLLDFIGCFGIRLFGGQFQQLGAIAQAAGEFVQGIDDTLELGAFLTEFLSAVGVVPYSGLLELAGYFLEAFVLVVVIKDTSSRIRYVPRDL